MTDPGPNAAGWVVVIPAKSLGTAKSRLAGAVGAARARLAIAMLADTISAARSATSVTAVLVVTDDADIAATASVQRARVVADQPRAGLNAAFSHGADVVRAEYAGSGVVLLAGDLPALQPVHLDAVLAVAAAATTVVVADRQGTGTTLLAGRAMVHLRPAFGPDSLARHLALGALEVDLLDLEGLHCDVDDADDLLEAVRLGVGRATAKELSSATGS